MEEKNVKCQNCKEVNAEETLNTLRKDKEVRDKAITNIIKELNKIVSENFNLKIENEKLRKEKSRLSSELQALTEINNECKRQYDDLKRLENESKTMCDDCGLQHKECHCDCAREFIPKDKMEGTVKNYVLVFDTLEELFYFLMR